MSKCLECRFCKTRKSGEKTIYSCNEAGMLTMHEDLLPKECKRYKKRVKK